MRGNSLIGPLCSGQSGIAEKSSDFAGETVEPHLTRAESIRFRSTLHGNTKSINSVILGSLI
jgi:hypothetical protein